MKAASDRQTQTQSVLQNMIDSTETVSTEQVASQILATSDLLVRLLPDDLHAFQLTLTKFLSGGL